MVTLSPVESSNVKAVGYDPQSSELHVQFGSGTYVYQNVPPETHQGLINAQSIGGHFAENIRGQFKHRKA